TGQIGEVMSESSNIAFSHVRSLLSKDEEALKLLAQNTIHLHIPAGATPKDGPSAGITMATSFYSLLTSRKVRGDVAMTGELTLTGKVFPIGGLKEKLIAAKRAGIKHIIFPKLNERDLEEVPKHIKKGLTFHPVNEIGEVLDIALHPAAKKTGSAKKEKTLKK
ncbi:MAG TPA: magnesium chelatase domain-containing protein, partial [Spirochaetota bacterium]|nr:magnesium chelatase domain-containing protein [Spirochaetota bacterium]